MLLKVKEESLDSSYQTSPFCPLLGEIQWNWARSYGKKSEDPSHIKQKFVRKRKTSFQPIFTNAENSTPRDFELDCFNLACVNESEKCSGDNKVNDDHIRTTGTTGISQVLGPDASIPKFQGLTGGEIIGKRKRRPNPKYVEEFSETDHFSHWRKSESLIHDSSKSFSIRKPAADLCWDRSERLSLVYKSNSPVVSGIQLPLILQVQRRRTRRNRSSFVKCRAIENLDNFCEKVSPLQGMKCDSDTVGQKHITPTHSSDIDFHQDKEIEQNPRKPAVDNYQFDRDRTDGSGLEPSRASYENTPESVGNGVGYQENNVYVGLMQSDTDGDDFDQDKKTKEMTSPHMVATVPCGITSADRNQMNSLIPYQEKLVERETLSNADLHNDSQSLKTLTHESLGNISDIYAKTTETAKGGFRRKHHRSWGLHEVFKLVEGVSHYGVGKWSEIKKAAFSNAEYRTPVDLKDKWRNLLRASYAQLQTNSQDTRRRKQGHSSIPIDILIRVQELSGCGQ